MCSDNYLDQFYGQFITFVQGGSWSTHGNSGIFEFSTELKVMYMDNLAYKHQANILVANELKLNGKKNADQILKYCLMYEYLLKKGFIDEGAKFLLLFIGNSTLEKDKQSLVSQEITMCQRKPKKYKNLLKEELLEIVARSEVMSMTWADLITFNNRYLQENDICQVEQKLLQGFNQTLQSKSFMNL